MSRTGVATEAQNIKRSSCNSVIKWIRILIIYILVQC